MRRFKKILLVVDEKMRRDSVLERAVERATRNGAELTLVRVLRFPWSGSASGPADDFEQRFESNAVTESERGLDRLARSIGKRDVAVDTKVLVGRPFIQIIRHVLRHGHDLVVLAAERSPGSGLFFGTTSMHLMRKCPCPVWVMKRGRLKRFRRILAAVDTDPYQPQPVVNRTILQLAASQARLDGAELHVVHAWDVTLSQRLRRPSGMSQRRQDSYTRKIREAHRDTLFKRLGEVDLSDLTPKVHLLKGDAGKVIPRVASRHAVDHLVMGSLARTGIPGLLIGTTAERILHRVRCSVLAVKPESFVSPVRPEG